MDGRAGGEFVRGGEQVADFFPGGEGVELVESAFQEELMGQEVGVGSNRQAFRVRNQVGIGRGHVRVKVCDGYDGVPAGSLEKRACFPGEFENFDGGPVGQKGLGRQ